MASPYSFFATVLADILANHQMTLDDLDSEQFRGRTTDADLRLKPEVIRRLKQSLVNEYTYPTLSRENLAKVIKMAGIKSNEERLRLVAAIAATKVQADLANRIGTRRAYMAAEKLHPLLIEGMRELEENEDFNGTFKGGNNMQDLTEFDRTYHEALLAIDRGLLVLNEIKYIEEINEKQAAAKQAYDAFTLALARLDARPEKSDAWEYWHQEAAQGQAEARRYLAASPAA